MERLIRKNKKIKIKSNYILNKKIRYTLAKSFKKPRNGRSDVKDEDGEYITNPDEIYVRWMEYLKDLINVSQDE